MMTRRERSMTRNKYQMKITSGFKSDRLRCRSLLYSDAAWLDFVESLYIISTKEKED